MTTETAQTEAPSHNEAAPAQAPPAQPEAPSAGSLTMGDIVNHPMVRNLISGNQQLMEKFAALEKSTTTPEKKQSPAQVDPAIQQMGEQLKAIQTQLAEERFQNEFITATSSLKFEHENAKNMALRDFKDRFEKREDGAWVDKKTGNIQFDATGAQFAPLGEVVTKFLKNEMPFLLSKAQPVGESAIGGRQAGNTSNPNQYVPTQADLDNPYFMSAVGMAGEMAALTRSGALNLEKVKQFM
jgi:hypothetical protein